MKNVVHNLRYLKDTRRVLRRKATSEEEILWKEIRNNQLNGKKFKRQHSIGAYITDFYCSEEKLVIEIDGAHHFSDEQKQHDKERTEYLQQLGITVLRFTNSQVSNDIDRVLADIKCHSGK